MAGLEPQQVGVGSEGEPARDAMIEAGAILQPIESLGRSLAGDEGTVALIEVSTAGYKEHGRFNPPDRSEMESWTHPVVANGKLYLRDQDVLLCYSVGK